ncbi:MAG: undecaprenyldiphospho-muramoylpentapeptide beta-N-acetylglucosaminyltransferase [Candidatus Symbiothrix sp.]|jgi:UDP-N-acetylglucosamine--N-acetylmuramyl-(pentapeptide) pyrophosphoryl-undecaprenol N-acetylglucosamine transferase|nr:undecaprenyldiphospho-muramoylpentapeptide beta-N-acetylglucosaminyltransferase [Candidatus Symbiothrix sp.]
MKVIISGGGTGGHIFPAIAIANEIKARHPKAEILFVGAEDRMEMERVPAAGYKIVGLPVAGFDRKNLWKNIPVLFKLGRSLTKARKIVKEFRPSIVIGVGGYASGPLLKAAAQLGYPALLQEQNSFAGVTNKLLAKNAEIICVAYEGMEAFFPPEKIVLTGNPVRQDLVVTKAKKQEAYTYFGLNPNKKTVLVLGGSLGARTINESMQAYIRRIEEGDVQFIWQTGKSVVSVGEVPAGGLQGRELYKKGPSWVRLEFISRMDLAYSVADLIVSRAGAGSISEFCLLGKPVILVPSPNVAEDHQTKNAQALVKKGAAVMITDDRAVDELLPRAMELIHNDERLKKLSSNISKLGEPDAAKKIVDEIDAIA